MGQIYLWQNKYLSYNHEAIYTKKKILSKNTLFFFHFILVSPQCSNAKRVKRIKQTTFVTTMKTAIFFQKAQYKKGRRANKKIDT